MKMMLRWGLVILLGGLGLSSLGAAPGAGGAAEGELPDAFPSPSPRAYLSHAALPAGGAGTLLVVLEVADDFHIQINDFLEVRAADGSPLSLGKWSATRTTPYHGEPALKGRTALALPLTVAADAAAGQVELHLFFGYQGCAEEPIFACFPPDEVELTLPLEILPAGGAPRSANAEVFAAQGVTPAGAPAQPAPAAAEAQGTTRAEPASAPAEAASPAPIAAEPPAGSITEPPAQPAGAGDAAPSGGGLAARLEGALARGSLLAFVLVFVGGILTSFTPCVYPMIPITISFVGGRARNRAHGFVLSLFFVLGIAIMYSALGLVAASTGAIFGSAMQSTPLLLVVAAIFAAMGASMLGAFDLALPAGMQGRMTSGAQRGGVIGAVLMGMVTGLVASPCVGPVLVVLLTFVAKTGSLLFGFWLLFTFACGLGLLFLVLGTFAGALQALPGAGGWMDTVKHVFGVILIAMAIYYLRTIIGAQWMRFAFGAFLVFVGTYMGALTPLAEGAGGRASFRKGLSLLILLAGALLFVLWLAVAAGAPALLLAGAPHGAAVAAGGPAAGQPAHPGPAWRVNDEAALAEAAAQGKPVVMDFYADWCGACVELDEKTWIDPAVIAEARRFVAIKMDFTRRDEFSKAATARYAVKGMPTVIFYDSQGREAARFFGFKGAPEVLEIMRGVR